MKSVLTHVHAVSNKQLDLQAGILGSKHPTQFETGGIPTLADQEYEAFSE